MFLESFNKTNHLTRHIAMICLRFLTRKARTDHILPRLRRTSSLPPKSIKPKFSSSSSDVLLYSFHKNKHLLAAVITVGGTVFAISGIMTIQKMIAGRCQCFHNVREVIAVFGCHSQTHPGIKYYTGCPKTPGTLSVIKRIMIAVHTHWNVPLFSMTSNFLGRWAKGSILFWPEQAKWEK